MRSLLKALGILSLIPLGSLFMALVIILAAWLSISLTLGNSAVFQAEFEKNVSQDDLKSLAGQIGLSLVQVEVEGAAGSAGNILPLDEAWFAETVKKLVLGIHTYITGASDSLPSLPMRPFYNSLQESIVAGIVQNSGSSGEILKILITEVKKMPGGGLSGGEPSELAVALLLKSGALQGLNLTRETAILILKVLLTSPDQASPAELLTRVVRLVISNQLKLDAAREDLDLNLFLNLYFASDDHVIAAAHDLFLDITQALTKVLILALAILTLLLVALSFSRTTSFYWIGIPLIISSLVLLAGQLALSFIKSGLLDSLPGRSLDADSLDLDFLQKLLAAVLKQVSQALLLAAGLVFAAGFLLVIAGAILSERKKRNQPDWLTENQTEQETASSQPPRWHLVRLPVVLILVVLLYVLIHGFIIQVENDIATLGQSVDKPADLPFFQIFDAAAGTNFSSLIHDEPVK